MTNPANHGSITGNLAADPISFTNEDGSKKVFVTIYTRRNFKNRAGQRDSDRISLETFVSAQTKGLGIFDYLHQGDLVQFAYTMRSEEYPHPATGEIIYKQYLRIESANPLESRAVTTERLARRLREAQQAPEAATAPEPTEEAQPAPKTRQRRQKTAQPA